MVLLLRKGAWQRNVDNRTHPVAVVSTVRISIVVADRNDFNSRFQLEGARPSTCQTSPRGK